MINHVSWKTNVTIFDIVLGITQKDLRKDNRYVMNDYSNINVELCTSQ